MTRDKAHVYSVYRVVSLLLVPWVLWRTHARAAPQYRRRWRERLGRVPVLPTGAIWVHAASVGEVNAGRKLIEELLDAGETVVVSTFTTTGAEQLASRFGARVPHVFLPLDTAAATRRWLATLRPRLGLILETELWPVLFRAAARRAVPLALVSARLSPRSAVRYRRVHRMMRGTLDGVRLIACQTDQDAARFVALGAQPERVRVVGNLKFDVEAGHEVPPATLAAVRGQRPIWVAGSTHRNEETRLLAAHRMVRRSIPDALLVLVPRHPERADDVAGWLRACACPFVSLDDPVEAGTEVVLVDRLGVLTACYAAADIAFVGGSLGVAGGHNLLEPARLGRPVISGPGGLAQSAGEAMRAGGALRVVTDEEALAAVLIELFEDPQQRAMLGRAALDFSRSESGAVRRTLELIRALEGLPG